MGFGFRMTQCQIGGNADGNRPAVLTMQQPRGADGDQIQGVTHDIAIGPSGVRDDKTVPFPIEELQTQLGFKRFHLVADCPLDHG